MRLSETYVHTIKAKAKEIFGRSTKIYLFGSRIDDSKRGGDIDLLILPENGTDESNKINKFYTHLLLNLGIQKIDIIVKRENELRPIVASALNTCIEL